MKPINVDELFNRKSFIDEKDFTLKVNESTEKPVVAEYITEEAYAYPDKLDKEFVFPTESFKKQIRFLES